MFRKILASLALAMCVTTSFSAVQTVIPTEGLSEAAIAELKAIAAKKVAETAAQASKSSEVVPEKITAGVTLAATWGSQAAAAAEGFAKAMGIAARELNVTINDFLKSDAGKLTAILIIWKVAGAAFLKMLYGIMFVTVGLTLVRVIYIRLFTKGFEKVEYSRFGGLFKGTKMVRVPKGFQDLRQDGEWLAFWLMVILTISTLIAGGMFF